MDYTGVIKRAWRITWRYRILWLFGLFVGGGGGGGGGGQVNYRFGGGEALPPGLERLDRELERLVRWAEQNVALLLAAGGLFLLIGLIWLILSIAAAPALVRLVDEAEEGRPVRGGEGWRVGFRFWWRHLGLALVLYLPLIAGFLVLIGSGVIALAPLFQGDMGGGAAAGALFGVCCFGGLFVLVLIVASILVGLIYTLGLRFLVLGGETVFGAIGKAWSAVRRRFKDVALMWLLVLAVSIGYAIVAGLIAGLLALPAIFMLFAGNLFGAALIFVALFFVLLPLSAIFGAFQSAIWTVFFRDLTGRGPVAAAEAAPGAPGSPWPSPAAPPPARPPAAPHPEETFLPPPPPQAAPERPREPPPAAPPAAPPRPPEEPPQPPPRAPEEPPREA
ncbi:MAG: hypothetical protein IBX62_00690 [Coriobacteriia bacterium]|nr:hypothetical protein [Coriobacteriia bacterium]